MTLSPDQVAHYREFGYVSPVEVMSEDEAQHLLDRLIDAEARFVGQLDGDNRNNAHLILPFLWQLVQEPRILGPVEALVGRVSHLWSSVLFIKEPDSEAFVSWHQDSTYMGLDGNNMVTPWLALTPSTVQSGCVAVISGSHTAGIHDHVDTFSDDNILTRGQEVRAIDESAVVNLELRPGQMSLHHPWLVHGSLPNRTGARRVGVALQCYHGAGVTPQRGVHYVAPVAGRSVPEPYRPVAAPAVACSATAIRERDRANAAFADVLYDGADQRRDL